MAPPKKSPTNADLSAKLDTVIRDTKQMNTRLGVAERELSILTTWKLQEDAYRAALKQVHKEQDDKDAKDERSGGNNSDRLLNKELLKFLGLTIAAIVTLVALIKAGK